MKKHNLETPFAKEISDNYNKAHADYVHSENCRANRATRRKIVESMRKEAISNQMYFALFCVCAFFIGLVVVGWTI